MKDLKATRDQRISKIESSKESYLGLLKQLQMEEERETEGLLMGRVVGQAETGEMLDEMGENGAT
jgi:hypothetical protein